MTKQHLGTSRDLPCELRVWYNQGSGSLTFLISLPSLSYFFLIAKLILGNFQVIFLQKLHYHFPKLN